MQQARIRQGVVVAFGLSVSSTAFAQVGVPDNGFPNWAERTDLVLSNRARADPATALSGCPSGNCPDSSCYTPVPPLVYGYTLNVSARFHVTNLVASGSMLQHPSPCLLASNIASTYPASCTNADPSCACSGGAAACTCSSCSCDSTQSSCVTQPFDRIALFTPTACDMACGENIAAGYNDPQATMQGWLLEQCGGWNGQCPGSCSSGENGHRANILSGSYTTLGSGAVTATSNSACYQGDWQGQDFSGQSATIPKLVAGSHFPQSGTSVQFWANWYDTAPPSSAQVNVAGACNTMTVDRGTGGNATYTWQGTVPSGCSPYVFTFKDSTGAAFTVPSAGAYEVGTSCTDDYVTTAPTGCGGSGSSSGGSADGGSGSGSGSGGTGSGSGGGSGSGSGGGGSGGGSGGGGSGGGSGGGGDASIGPSSGSGSGGGTSGDGGWGAGDNPFNSPSSGCGCTAVGERDPRAAWLLALTGLAMAGGVRRRVRGIRQ